MTNRSFFTLYRVLLSYQYVDKILLKRILDKRNRTFRGDDNLRYNTIRDNEVDLLELKQ